MKYRPRTGQNIFSLYLLRKNFLFFKFLIMFLLPLRLTNVVSMTLIICYKYPTKKILNFNNFTLIFWIFHIFHFSRVDSTRKTHFLRDKKLSWFLIAGVRDISYFWSILWLYFFQRFLEKFLQWINTVVRVTFLDFRPQGPTHTQCFTHFLYHL